MWTYYQGDRVRVEAGLTALAQFLTADPATLPDLAPEVERRTRLNRAVLCCDSKEGSCR